jgi:hypothetical protein
MQGTGADPYSSNAPGFDRRSLVEPGNPEGMRDYKNDTPR